MLTRTVNLFFNFSDYHRLFLLFFESWFGKSELCLWRLPFDCQWIYIKFSQIMFPVRNFLNLHHPTASPGQGGLCKPSFEEHRNFYNGAKTKLCHSFSQVLPLFWKFAKQFRIFIFYLNASACFNHNATFHIPQPPLLL